MLGLLTLALSTIGFGLSVSIPGWAVTRVLQGAGSAAAGEWVCGGLGLWVEGCAYVMCMCAWHM